MRLRSHGDQLANVQRDFGEYSAEQLKVMAKAQSLNERLPIRDLIAQLSTLNLTPTEEKSTGSFRPNALRQYSWSSGASFTSYDPIDPLPNSIDIEEVDESPTTLLTSTPRKATVPSAEYRQLQQEDATWCATHLPGRVYQATSKELAARLFGDLSAFNRRARLAENKITSRTLADVGQCVAKEKDAEPVEMNGKYWLSWLAELSGETNTDLRFERGPRQVMNEGQRAKGKRKLDAALIPADGILLQWDNILVPIEFTASPLAKNAFLAVGKASGVAKLQQLVLNLVDTFVEQPERRFVFGISFHQNDVVLCILDHEALTIARLENVATSAASTMAGDRKALAEVSALLGLLLSSSVYAVGLNPAVEYDIGRTIIPRTIQLSRPWKIELELLSPTTRNPFSKATAVRVASPLSSTSIAASSSMSPAMYWSKIYDVDDQRAGREQSAYDFLRNALTPYPSYLPSLAECTIFPRSPKKQLSPEALSHPYIIKTPVSSSGSKKPNQVVPRHLEILILGGSHDTISISDLKDPQIVIEVFAQLLESIGELGELGYTNGDLSSSNIRCKITPSGTPLLHRPLFWIDHESAHFPGKSAPSPYPRSATLDVMSVADLRALQDVDGQITEATPRKDLESLAYLLFKTITKACTSSESSSNTRTRLEHMAWDTLEDPANLLSRRAGFWKCSKGKGLHQQRCFQLIQAVGSGCTPFGELLLGLLEAALGEEYWDEAERNDWQTVYKGMMETFEDARMAVRDGRVPSTWPQV